MLKTSGAFDKIKKYLLEDDGIVYGGSAGAIIFGKDLDTCYLDDDNDIELEEILNTVNFDNLINISKLGSVRFDSQLDIVLSVTNNLLASCA